MLTQLRFIVAFSLPAMVLAQVPSTAATGAFSVGERDVQFTSSVLATPTVDTKVFYPATSAGANQPVANGTFPVIGFGHGFNLNYLDYQILCKHLASWGYIVITPDVQNGFNVDHAEFALELSESMQYLLSQGALSSSPFFQKTDTMTGVLGHSMGGGASALVPTVYPSIDAVSGLAAAETTPSAIAALANYNGPYQIISGSSDNTAPEASNQIPMYNAATGSKQHVSITGGAHCKFTDASTICDFVSSAGTVTRTEQIYLAKKYATAFFNYHLKGDVLALHFLCGDSLQADINTGKVTANTNINCLVGMQDPLQDNSLKAWPIPNDGLLYFEASGTVTLSDLSGKALRQTIVLDGNSGSMDVRLLPAGLYVLRNGEESTLVIRR